MGTSNSIAFKEFESEMAPILGEARELNRRLSILRSQFLELAGKVADDGSVDEENFREDIFEYASNFFERIDYDSSHVEFGDVQIWEASSC